MPALSIASSFRAAANFAIDDEVDLFRKLAIAIASGCSAIFIQETHGAVAYNVKFDLTSGVGTRCEIADLLIISRSDVEPFYRATFWQAKKQPTAKWVALGTPDKHVDFKGQFNQWDLLSRRPNIVGVPPFVPPADLLSSFSSASIGSFGVFYERASQIEVVHSVASFISCSSPSAKHPVMVANAYLEQYFYNCREILVRTELCTFLNALLHHQIGAPIELSVKAQRWLLSYARKKVVAAGRGDELEGFFNAANDLEALDMQHDNDGLSVLLVDSRNAV